MFQFLRDIANRYWGPDLDAPQLPAIDRSPRPLTGQSPQLQQGQSTFIPKADLVTHKQHAKETWPLLYLVTSCPAIADYCLAPTDSLSGPGDRESQEHLEVCLRMRRCGAGETTPVPWMDGSDCDTRLEKHLNKQPYVFGWPSGASGAPQPVWVFYIFRRHDGDFFQGRIRLYGAEAQLGVEWLQGCATMEEYCERLRFHGAVYYDDVRDSPAAREMGVVDRAERLADA